MRAPTRFGVTLVETVVIAICTTLVCGLTMPFLQELAGANDGGTPIRY